MSTTPTSPNPNSTKRTDRPPGLVSGNGRVWSTRYRDGAQWPDEYAVSSADRSRHNRRARCLTGQASSSRLDTKWRSSHGSLGLRDVGRATLSATIARRRAILASSAALLATVLVTGFAGAAFAHDGAPHTVRGHIEEDSVAHDAAMERQLARLTGAATAADAATAEAAVAGNEAEVGHWGRSRTGRWSGSTWRCSRTGRCSPTTR